MEVRECIEVLHGGGPEDLRELCSHLAAWMFYLGGAPKTVAEGKVLAEQIIASGKAFERFRQMVELQGGDVSVIDDPTRLPSAPIATSSCPVRQAGYVSAIACEHVGTACVILGGGREKQRRFRRSRSGHCRSQKNWRSSASGESLCTIHCHSEAQAARARSLLEEELYDCCRPPRAHSRR